MSGYGKNRRDPPTAYLRETQRLTLTTVAKRTRPNCGSGHRYVETIYDTVCTALLPNADVTVDWFHVMQAVNKELKQLKNQEKKAQPEAFKGAHYALLKNQQDLTDKQATALEQVYRACPPVKMAHRLKECLRRIFESHATKDLAQKRLDKWRQIAEQEKLFPEFRKTLAN